MDMFSADEIKLLAHVNSLLIESGGWAKYVGTPLGRFLIETISVDESRRAAPMPAGAKMQRRIN
jgi:hypothetical protein